MAKKAASKVSRPEHEKLDLVRDKSQAIGEFLEWLTGFKGLILAEYPRKGSREQLLQTTVTRNELLADYFEIDLEALEREKRVMLANFNKETRRERRQT